MIRHPPLLAVFFAALLALSARTSAADDWPQFRGPTGQGTSEAADSPVEWGPNKNVVWKAPVPGAGWSSPVVGGGKVYLTTAAGPGGSAKGPVSLWAVCLDAATGKVLWDTEVFKPDQNAVRAKHAKNSPASATPVLTADRLYVHFGHLGTAALDPAGKVVWRQTGITYQPVHGNGGSPALVGDVLIFTCDGGQNPFVAGLDANTGDIKWKTPRNTPARKPFSFSTPLAIDVGGAKQVICPGSGFVAAYDPATGREQWRVGYGEGYSVVPRPVFANGLLILSSGFDQPVLYAIKPDGAKGDATRTNVAWTMRKGAPNTPSPLVVGDEVYVVSDQGVATCADAKTGQERWTHRLNGGFSASPVYAAGRVYFQNEAGVGYVVKAGKTFEQVAQNDLGEPSLASYAVADGALFIRTEKHLWRVGKGAQPQ